VNLFVGMLACIGVLLVGSPVRAQPVNLAPTWKSGDVATFQYTSDSTRRDEIPAARASQEQRTRQEMTIKRTVVETSPTGTTLDLVFERIKVVITQGRMFMLYDSAKPPEPDRSNVLEDAAKPMLGVPIRVRLDGSGKVVDVSGFPEPRTVDGKVRPLIVDEEMVRNSLAPLYGMQKTPPTAKVGDRWNFEEQLRGETGTALVMRHQRTVESADFSGALIAATATAEIKPLTPGAQPKLLMAEFDCKSRFQWDSTKGRLGWMVLEQRIEMHGTVRQARSEQTTTVRMTLAAEGFTPPAPAAAPAEAGTPPASTP
jgi:hypothetical protein